MQIKELIYRSITEVLNISVDDILKKHNATAVNAKAIFCHHTHGLMSLDDIADELQAKSKASIYYYRRLYQNRYRSNKLFKVLADRVKEIIYEE